MNFLMEQVFNRPLLLEQTRAQMIMDVLAPRFGMDVKDLQHFEKDMALFGSVRTDSSVTTIHNGVAVVPILGTLVQRRMNVNPMSGSLLSFQEIAANILAAAEDDRVDSILLDISSGGGQADSAFDLARTIREIDQTMKPVFAIANSAAFSAAFAIASGARKIFVSETGGVGSVGVFAQHVDFSKQNEMKGIEVTLIKSGGLKAERSPDFPLSKEAEARIQEEVDKIFSIFVDVISEHRGMSAKKIIETQAGLFFGADAVEAGFADQVANFDEAIESILQSDETQVTIGQANQANQIKQAGDAQMKIFSKKKEALNAVAEEQEDNATAAADEEVDTAEVNQEVEIEVETEVETEVEDKKVKTEAETSTAKFDVKINLDASAINKINADAAEIMQLAIDAGHSALAPDMIREGLTLEEVTEKLQITERITDLCRLAKMPKLAEKFMEDSKTVAEVQDILIDKLARKAEKYDISSKGSAEAIDQEAVKEYAEGNQDNALIRSAKEIRDKAQTKK